MVESVLHLLKVHRKMILGNTTIIVQDMFGKTPKTLNAVDMILGLLADHRFQVIHREMFAQPLQGVVAPEGVRVVDGTLSGFLPDDRHEFFLGHMLHHAGIDLSIALQKAKNDVFARSPSSALSFASAAKVALVHLHFARESLALKFGDVIDGFTKLLIHTRDGLVVGAQISRETIRRLLLIEALHDGNFHADALQGFLFSTGFVATPYISASGLRYLKRTAENTLFAPQKVGRAPKNILSSIYHKDIVAPYGYETP